MIDPGFYNTDCIAILIAIFEIFILCLLIYREMMK